MKPTLSFGKAVAQCFSKLFDFNGRARRSEFWWFYLLYIIIYCTIVSLSTFYKESLSDEAGYVLVLIVLVVIICGLAVSVRRLHDTGRSGWYLFTSLIPVVGSLVLLYYLVEDSEVGTNKYGPSPKYDDESTHHAFSESNQTEVQF